MLTKSDFIDWKSNPTTKEVFNQLRQYIEGLQVELGQSAGIDPRLDSIKVGAIQAYNDILGIEFDEETQRD